MSKTSTTEINDKNVQHVFTFLHHLHCGSELTSVTGTYCVKKEFRNAKLSCLNKMDLLLSKATIRAPFMNSVTFSISPDKVPNLKSRP